LISFAGQRRSHRASGSSSLGASQASYSVSGFVPELVERSEEAAVLLFDAPRVLFATLADELGMNSA